VLVLAALACGGDDTTIPPATAPPATQAPPSTAAPTKAPPTAAPQAGGASIEITNASGVEVWYIQISPAKADSWGDDWLGDVIIADGQTHTIADIPEGRYDVRALDRDANEIEVLWGMDISGNMTWEITGTEAVGGFEIINHTDETIGYLYISPVESASWGEDWLGENVIEAGETHVVTGVSAGNYDVRATNLDEEVIEVLYNVPLSGQDTWTVVGKTPLPSNAALRFNEPFDDNRNNWGLDSQDENVFYQRPANGEYCILIKSSQFTAWEWYEPFRTDEFVAEVACTLSGAADASCGLGFGPDGDNIYWYEVSPSDQTLGLFLLENDQWQDMLVPWTTSRNINPSGQNYMSMERVGGVVSLYVNGVLVQEIASDRFPQGRLGIGGSTYDEGNATVCLDNLRVWRLE
jgi:hypothetical protein